MPRMTTGSVLAMFCDEYHDALREEPDYRAFDRAWVKTHNVGFSNESPAGRAMLRVGVALEMGTIAIYRNGGPLFSVLTQHPHDNYGVLGHGWELICTSSRPVL